MENWLTPEYSEFDVSFNGNASAYFTQQSITIFKSYGGLMEKFKPRRRAERGSYRRFDMG